MRDDVVDGRNLRRVPESEEGREMTSTLSRRAVEGRAL